jgi:predicted DNA binding CopG/RHH family protein
MVNTNEKVTAGGHPLKVESDIEKEARWRKEIAEENAARKVTADTQRQKTDEITAALHARKAAETAEYQKLRKAAVARLTVEIPDMLIEAIKGKVKYHGRAIPEVMRNIASGLQGMVDRMAQDEVSAQMVAVRERLAREAAAPKAEQVTA